MILVSGATGTIGRPPVDLLVGQRVEARAATRNPQGIFNLTIEQRRNNKNVTNSLRLS
jgi:uncharacterized protein YbjT (DUF2867 family)